LHCENARAPTQKIDHPSNLIGTSAFVACFIKEDRYENANSKKSASAAGLISVGAQITIEQG